MAIEEVLHRHYARTGTTQPELAHKLGVSQSTIHKWISGKTKIPLKYYYSICELCGTNLKDFIPCEWTSAIRQY